MEKIKLTIITSHVVQYQAPFFKKLAKYQEIDLIVYFCWKFGAKKTYDVQFGKDIEWDIPLLEGYKYKFLKNFSLRPSSDFFGQINPGIVVELIRNRPDAVLIYGWNSFANWLIFITAFLSGLPVLLHSENPLNQELLKSKWKLVIKKIIFGKLLFPRVSAFLYIGEENRKFYKYYGVPDEKLFFVPYAVDNNRFINKAIEIKNQKSKIKNALGIDENDVVILFVGKLIEKKRPMDLLKAFSILKTSDILRTSDVQRLTLVFVGDGALRPELKNYVKKHNLKNVHFAGFKNQTELPKYYAIADIFVLPSGIGETWGLVVNEAMCFDLPVIVSDIVGCGPDLVSDGENGFIFPVGDVEALANYLGEVFLKKNLFQGKSLKKIQDYSFDKGVLALEKIFNALKLRRVS